MFRLIPPPLHRQALRLAHGARRLWWQMARPRVIGVRVLALDAQDRVLLVRHSYGTPGWMPPAGGARRGESLRAAAMRELAEETCCTLAGAVEIAVSEEDLCGALNEVHVFAGRAGGQPRADGREIVAAEFFSAQALPEAMPEKFHAMLPGWLAQAVQALR